MKKVVSLILAVLMLVGCVSAMAETVKMDKLTFEFCPPRMPTSSLPAPRTCLN